MRALRDSVHVLRTAESHRRRDDDGRSIVGATPAGRRWRLRSGNGRRSMTSPETDVIVAIVGRSQAGRRRNIGTPHSQFGPEVKRRRAGARTASVSLSFTYL